MRRRGWETRPADAAAADTIGDASRTYPGPQAVSIRVRRPMTAAWTKRGIAPQRLGQQVEQFIAIEGIHSPTIWLERKRNIGDGHGLRRVARASAHRREDVLGALPGCTEPAESAREAFPARRSLTYHRRAGAHLDDRSRA